MTDTVTTSLSKTDVLRVLETLPEKFPMEKIVYHLNVIIALQEAMENVNKGHTVPHSEVLKVVESWK